MIKAKRRFSGKQERNAYELGYDCGKNGGNRINCHFSIFSQPKYTKAWLHGKADAQEVIEVETRT